ncbi:DNA repair protein [Salix suchowensis]|nr:DNA repair protein [Salix suchowensis]
MVNEGQRRHIRDTSRFRATHFKHIFPFFVLLPGMACLDKLATCGTRAFDDKNLAVIEFFSPVTVIVGHNGSGKTTIIECLKYATTGDQPANTCGGAFVHDPKMTNEKEVKAQVKLRFRAANGSRMLAVRNLSVTVKKTGLTMKTLESILALDDGEKKPRGTSPTMCCIYRAHVLEGKCAEIDADIPQLLGMSKSVLENVIFCHQEDSYWHLAEPSALKKKFDDIFEATRFVRYTKALDSIKSLRKDRAADLKAEKEHLESLSREKTHADKLKGCIADLNTTIASKEVYHDEVKREFDELVIANQKFYDYATKFREARYQEELDEAKMNIQEVVGKFESPFRHDLLFMVDGRHGEELEARLQNFDGHISEQKRKKKAEDGKKQDLEDQLSNARRKHVELLQEQGSLRAEAKVLEFISKLNDIQRRQRTQFEKLQVRDPSIQYISFMEDHHRRPKAKRERRNTTTNPDSSLMNSKGSNSSALMLENPYTGRTLYQPEVNHGTRCVRVSKQRTQVDNRVVTPGTTRVPSVVGYSWLTCGCEPPWTRDKQPRALPLWSYRGSIPALPIPSV